MKLRKKINLFEEFKSEVVSSTRPSNTKSNEVPVNTKTETDGIKTEVLKDVDSILNNLETLSAQIDEKHIIMTNTIMECYDAIIEELEKETLDFDAISAKLEQYNQILEETDLDESAELNEGGKEVATKVWNFVWHMPRAAKAQQKVEKQKLNLQSLQLAADQAPNKEQREKIAAKAARVKDMVSQLQAEVTSKYKDKGGAVDSIIKKVKYMGSMERLKNEVGNGGDKADLKGRIKELAMKMKEEDKALKQLEPSEADKQAAKEKAEARKNKRKEDIANTSQKVKDTMDKKDQEALDAQKAEKEKAKRPESGKNSKEDMIQRYKNMLDKAEDPEKKKAIQAKIDKLQNESEERFMDADFISILEAELLEFSKEIIVESFGFQTSSIADKFRKLL